MVDHEPDILLAWARWHLAQGNRDEARQQAAEALAIAERCEYRLEQAEIHNFLARWHFGRWRPGPGAAATPNSPRSAPGATARPIVINPPWTRRSGCWGSLTRPDRLRVAQPVRSGLCYARRACPSFQMRSHSGRSSSSSCLRSSKIWSRSRAAFSNSRLAAASFICFSSSPIR